VSPAIGTGAFVPAIRTVTVSPTVQSSLLAALNAPVGPLTNPDAEKNGTGGWRASGCPSTAILTSTESGSSGGPDSSVSATVPSLDAVAVTPRRSGGPPGQRRDEREDAGGNHDSDRDQQDGRDRRVSACHGSLWSRLR